MTIQSNGNKENNQPIEKPLLFSKEELNFINMTFRITREAFNYDLSVKNEKDIREAIRLYHNKYRMPGGRPHQLMRDIFRGLGYWEDGKTTLVERKNKIINEKMANEKRLAEMNLNRKRVLDEQLIAIQKEQDQIKNDPLMHKLDLTKEYEKIEVELRAQVKLQQEEQTLRLQEFLRDQQESYEKIVQNAFSEAEKGKKTIQEAAIKDAIIKSQKKLTDAMLNIEKVAPKIDITESEIIKQNKKITLELQDLEGKTVKELHKFADTNDINWSYSLRKDELIEHIQLEMDKKNEIEVI